VTNVAALLRRIDMATMAWRETTDAMMTPPDAGMLLVRAEVAELVRELEPTLTARQRSLLHQIRLASESLGAARAALVTRYR
jgi:hypothetical protein